MKINLTDENMKQVDRGEYLIVDGEVWEFVSDDERYFTTIGTFQRVYYKQPSTDKVFKIILFLTMYSYENYSFDDYMQNKVAIEVVQEAVCKMEWVEVEDSE